MNKLIALCVLLLMATGCATQSHVESAPEDPYVGVCSYLDIDVYDEHGELVDPRPPIGKLVEQVLAEAGISDVEIESTGVAHVGVKASEYEKALAALAASESLHGRDIQIYVSFTSRPEELDVQGDTVLVAPAGRTGRPFDYLWVQGQQMSLPSSVPFVSLWFNNKP